MESRKNGKLIIALLIMFAVAVSIVGVTYAYFVATFNTNQNPESVKVVAGKLIANYAHGTSIDVSNVVPGWVSDNLHYYDVGVAAANQGRIFASKKTDEGTTASYQTSNFGLATPISFEVTNNSTADSEVSYYIALNIANNGMYYNSITGSDEAKKSKYAADLPNLLVSLYSGTFNENKGVAENFGDGNELVSGPYVLGNTGDLQMLSVEPQTIAKNGAAQKFFVVFEYVNQAQIEQISQGITLNVEAVIKGIQEDNDNNDVWYDDDNNVVTFATASTLTKTAATDDAETDFYNASTLVPNAS